MLSDKRMIMSVIWVILGVVLVALGFAGKVDSFWNGMGSALLVVGSLQLLRHYRLSHNEAYREKYEIEVNDERNHFIRNKAWAWTGYLYVLIASVATIVLRVMGQDLLATAAGMTVCLVLVLYWVSYYVLKRKY